MAKDHLELIGREHLHGAAKRHAQVLVARLRSTRAAAHRPSATMTARCFWRSCSARANACRENGPQNMETSMLPDWRRTSGAKTALNDCLKMLPVKDSDMTT
eukprot:2516334-Pleurochrysis_carterae.AAC.1